MASPDRPPVLSLDRIEAVIFDLDGVLTDTASLHEEAWSTSFATLFEAQPDTTPAPFTGDDYRRLVDGESRLDGVRNVLADRGIELPEGAPEDEPGTRSTWAVANLKDADYRQRLEKEGPRPFPSSLELLDELARREVPIGVVSASRHCAEVLELAGITPLVQARVDGNSAAAMGLAGKPAPAMFLEAARRLGVAPSEAAVVEDAVAGVAAGRAGGFGLVVGVDRHDDPSGLFDGGADVVVADLGALVLEGRGPAEDAWHFELDDTEPASEGMRESLTTLGNGYLGTRGARCFATDDGVSYPGTYVAGLFNRVHTVLEGREVEEEGLVNVTNWLPVNFRVDGGGWMGEPGTIVSDHRSRIDLRRGVLRRFFDVTDAYGNITSVTERRLVSMATPHLCAIELVLVPRNWEGTVELRSVLDGSVTTSETVEERLLPHPHLEPEASGVDLPDFSWIVMSTNQSKVRVATAARTVVQPLPRSAAVHRVTIPVDPSHEEEPVTVAIGHDLVVEVGAGGSVHLEKVVSLHNSRDRSVSEPLLAARQDVARAGTFDELLRSHALAWDRLWHRAHLDVVTEEGNQGRVINLHMFHTLQVASPHVGELDVGLGARGLHGEGYRCHIFWDELFVFPVLNYRFPETARALLAYRWRRLDEARHAAKAAGHRGAMYPWQSASDGRDETPNMLFNSRSARWMPDRSSRQRHVGLAVAYELWQHWQSTGDTELFLGAPSEVLFEIARFFTSLATFDAAIAPYRLRGVMGPDEFHDGYPGTVAPGIDDNAYTNVLCAWLLARVLELAETLAHNPRDGVLERIGMGQDELDHMEAVSRLLYVPFHEGVISQFDGYEKLLQFDFERYRAQYGNLGRLDLILESEGDSTNHYQVAKQPDTLMLFYLLSAEELRQVLQRLGYELAPETLQRTIEYYEERSTQGSTLARVVHAWVSARADRADSWRYFDEALSSDIADIQGGTTREGIHLGAMAGTIDILQRCYTGLEVRDDRLHLNPMLPPELESINVPIAYRGHVLDIDIDHTRARVHLHSGSGAPFVIVFGDEELVLHAGDVVERPIDH